MKTKMKTKLTFIAALSAMVCFTSCKKETNEPIVTPVEDCNGVINGTSMIDDCGDCQQAYIYNMITHDPTAIVMLDDTANVELQAGEVVIMPNDPMNPYWNSGCASIEGTINELNASNYTVDPVSGTLSGDFVKFSFETADTVSGDNWDVAFRGTTIIVNGGMSSNADQPNRSGNAAVYIADGTLDDIASVDTSLFVQDGATSTAIIDDFGFTGMGWCAYDQTTHVITPIPGKVLVFRTHDNKYTKVEILNFYDTPMTSPYGGFYTFNYVYQSGGELTF